MEKRESHDDFLYDERLQSKCCLYKMKIYVIGWMQILSKGVAPRCTTFGGNFILKRAKFGPKQAGGGAGAV